MTYLANAFALSMVDENCTIEVHTLSVDEVKELLDNGFTSIVGHVSTTQLYGNLLGREIPMNRTTLKLQTEDTLVVGQYIGPRLEEGVIDLPENSSIIWKTVRYAI
jgi:hypothetical protein